MKPLFLFFAVLWPVFGFAQDPIYQYGALFKLTKLKDNKDCILLYKEQEKKIELYQLQSDGLKLLNSIPAVGRVCSAAVYDQAGQKKIAIGIGAGAGFTTVPPQVFLYDNRLSEGKQIFEAKSDRSDVTFLEQVGQDLAIFYFQSKYITTAGLLTPTTDRWSFNEKFTVRLGINVDYDLGAFLIGRPYRDEEQNKPELLLYKDSKFVELPSYRGVSSVLFANIDSDPEMEILIGDGWHQNYREQAEPRLTLLDIDTETQSYRSRVIDTSRPQINVAKIEQLGDGLGSVILAAGDQYIDAYSPQASWKKKRFYQKKTGEMASNLDFVTFTDGDNFRAAVWDGGLRLFEVPGSL